VLAPAIRDAGPSLAPRFDSARPFRHLVLDGFFEPAVAERLLASFPAFERGNARNEAGELGNKSTVEKIRELGPDWAALDDLVQSPEFLGWLSQATGITGLLYDPWYFGGGTHENRHGQDLDAHVDFNRHPVTGWHRRLNLIVYLNHDWDPAWGGALELHSDPRAPDDQVTAIAPLFNRCVVFETTEWSWHGFPRIDLPEDHRDRSRRSIALYFYTKERPAEELADPHSTIYVDRPLPAHLHAGHQLTEADMGELRVLLTRRDMHLKRLYDEITRTTVELEAARKALYAGRLGRLRWFLSGLRRRLKR